jgi:hypothetical protein
MTYECSAALVDEYTDVKAMRCVRLHDARVVDQHVEGRMVLDQLGRDPFDTSGVGNIQLDCRHAGVRRHHLVDMAAPASADDDLVAPLMQRFGQSTANARAAASDKDRVSAEFHDGVLKKIARVVQVDSCSA